MDDAREGDDIDGLVAGLKQKSGVGDPGSRTAGSTWSSRGKAWPKGEPFARQMNTAINQTLSRTVLTALTTFVSALVLFLFGGKGLEDSVFVLTVGVMTGTYSTSTFSAHSSWTGRIA